MNYKIEMVRKIIKEYLVSQGIQINNIQLNDCRGIGYANPNPIGVGKVILYLDKSNKIKEDLSYNLKQYIFDNHPGIQIDNVIIN